MEQAADRAAVLTKIRFNEQGLVPAIIQDVATRTVRMIGYMNAEAVQRTIETGFVHFWSRSRQRLWMKGETSGNVLELVELRADCDGDALLILVQPHGPTCHTGMTSCFDGQPLIQRPWPHSGSWVLDDVAAVIAERQASPREGSYTSYLFREGVDKIGKKIGEEAAEVIIAAKNGQPEPLANEVADLFYHVLVLLAAMNVPLLRVWDVLRQRRGRGAIDQPPSSSSSS
ncbi:bifunctional phosphoribosyl-AMP cyclohydrolase/phosphoribosyl-ATP diphosphatase HisIE [Thermorudis peleae]|uniref:bifunctional phosphoribosyl-AMP cyclohydrolase/phosphoribosyl-ATP diphosphatase HisIE n=1 Tax=Thermorudis peleae TaxID=1382356 RepID=UPI00056EE813|nr:bifunctional phosphoribosyl-AMP cyclohydrolase/phosphoribosyl-ATP diphosphatase HisIE [Thermorudis peleae]